MASVVYNSFKKEIMDGSIDLDNDTIKFALVTSSYTPDIDAHTRFDDVTNEVSASGSYSAGGATLSVTLAQDDTNDRGRFDAADFSFTSFTGTARGAVVYKSTGTASTSPLICYIDFGSDKSATDGTFSITIDTAGIFYIA